MSNKDSYVPDASFSSLVLTLSSSAWVGLGKIADPLSGEIKKDLKTAKFTIDTLIMLREKTRENLSDDENKLLQAVLGDLQGNYAEAVFAGEEADQKSAAASNETAGEAPAEGKAAESGDSAGKETGGNKRGDSEASKENKENKEKEESKEESKE